MRQARSTTWLIWSSGALMKTEPLILRGIGVAPGIAIGPAFIIGNTGLNAPEYTIAAAQVVDELLRFNHAVEQARRQIRQLQNRADALPADAAEEIKILLDAHHAMLSGSRLVRGVEDSIRSAKINAEAAIERQITSIAAGFASMDDHYLAARMADIREVGQRLLRHLMQQQHHPFAGAPEGSILLAEEITPADTALMNPDQIAGFAAVLGGAEGHAAIMARALAMPAVLGISALLHEVAQNETIIIDGTRGEIVIRPTAAQLRLARQKRKQQQDERSKLRGLRRLPAITRDGTTIALMANLELPRELDSALDSGAQGIGLLRTEFMFMNRNDLPNEEEQYEALRSLVDGLKGKPLTVRTLDVGGEKLAGAMGQLGAGSANPALGLRAIRLGLKMPKLLETQLAAILRASAHGPLRILIPMVSSVGQMRQVRQIMAQVARRLHRRGVKLPNPLPPLGAMIEIPGAALAADALAQVSDFFAIGSNDLTQYTLAIDRGDEQVAELYNPLHPAVLRLIQFTTVAALRARISVSLCGEMAGDPAYSALLIGLGLHELSMSPARLPQVKQEIRGLEMIAATGLAERIMAQSDEAEIARFINHASARISRYEK